MLPAYPTARPLGGSSSGKHASILLFAITRKQGLSSMRSRAFAMIPIITLPRLLRLTQKVAGQ